jgi:hypothetical protein
MQQTGTGHCSLTHLILLTLQQYRTDIVTPVTFKLFSLDNSSLT